MQFAAISEFHLPSHIAVYVYNLTTTFNFSLINLRPHNKNSPLLIKLKDLLILNIPLIFSLPLVFYPSTAFSQLDIQQPEFQPRWAQLRWPNWPRVWAYLPEPPSWSRSWTRCPWPAHSPDAHLATGQAGSHVSAIVGPMAMRAAAPAPGRVGCLAAVVVVRARVVPFRFEWQPARLPLLRVGISSFWLVRICELSRKMLLPLCCIIFS